MKTQDKREEERASLIYEFPLQSRLELYRISVSSVFGNTFNYTFFSLRNFLIFN